MQMPQVEPIPMPDETDPGPVPPMGPEPTEPDVEVPPLPGDEPGDDPGFPPERNPFPDTVEPPPEHPSSL